MLTIRELLNTLSRASWSFGQAPIEVDVRWLSDEHGIGPDSLLVTRAAVEGEGPTRRLVLYTAELDRSV